MGRNRPPCAARPRALSRRALRRTDRLCGRRRSLALIGVSGKPMRSGGKRLLHDVELGGVEAVFNLAALGRALWWREMFRDVLPADQHTLYASINDWHAT